MLLQTWKIHKGEETHLCCRLYPSRVSEGHRQKAAYPSNLRRPETGPAYNTNAPLRLYGFSKDLVEAVYTLTSLAAIVLFW